MMFKESDKGLIILLNGTSSSGKSSISTALQELIDVPFLHLNFDDFKVYYGKIFPDKFKYEVFPSHISDDELYSLRDQNSFWNHRYSAFLSIIENLVQTGHNVIVDIVLPTEHIQKKFVKVLAKCNLFTIGVHCTLGELDKRERQRKKRLIGLARRQFSRVHTHIKYDLEVDTVNNTPLQCAQKIIHILYG